MRSSLLTAAGALLTAQDVPFDPAGATEQMLGWSLIDYPHATAVKAALAERFAASSVNRHLAAVRGVVKVALMLGLVDADRSARVRLALTSLPPEYAGPDPTRMVVPDRALQQLFAHLAADAHPTARRDAALVAVLAQAGLRRSEAAALRVEDIHLADGTVIVRRGKGGRTRQVWLHGGAEAAVRDWLAVRGGQPGPLLCPVDKGGTVHAGTGLSGHAVWRRLKVVCERAGIPVIAPHDLRRKVITDLLSDGVDIAAAQRIAGHASVATTARYDMRGQEAARRAALHISVPYIAPRLTIPR